jgi:hypothetical protein
MEDAMGFTAEMEAAYTSFCLMYGLGAHTAAKPEDGGFARTKIARRISNWPRTGSRNATSIIRDRAPIFFVTYVKNEIYGLCP